MIRPIPIRLAFVEDSKAFADELRALLKHEPEIECVGVCPTAAAARLHLPALAPDVVLVDMGLPDGSGADLIRELLPRMAGTDFVVLTVFDDDETIQTAIANGATGYLLKRSGAARIIQGVRQVRGGGSAVDSEVLRRLLTLFRDRPKPTESLPELTAQENRLLSELTRGASVKEAADAIGVTYASARTYVRRIYAKLGVRSRTEAVRRFLNLDQPPVSSDRVG